MSFEVGSTGPHQRFDVGHRGAQQSFLFHHFLAAFHHFGLRHVFPSAGSVDRAWTGRQMAWPSPSARYTECAIIHSSSV